MNYRKINALGGWVAFAVSAFVYLSTIPTTASFWDCGEFIGCAYRLEVCHPPGSPLFLMIGRLFTMFAPSPADAATMVNAMSALASAATIMFLFWTITHLSRRLLGGQAGSEPSRGAALAIMAAGMVGALGYTFTDTFWFSAVEGEVYALSSLFTAMVFWAILRWEEVAHEPHANRWLLLIAYLMGLSIGIHLLNLLAIPAIVMVYYFKKHTPTRWGVVAMLAISAAITGAVVWGVIPYTVRVASWFELAMVNGLGLPFKSGMLLFAALLFAALAWGVYYSYGKGKVALNTVLLALALMVFGYGSYAMTVIRSNANPPMDQNSPDQMFSLLSYLNREQYGDRPLVYGQTYDAPAERVTFNKSYREGDGHYVPFDNTMNVDYDERFKMLFPRMYSASPDHVAQYKDWARIKGTKLRVSYGGESEERVKPTFAENLRFFFRYQVGFMYMRYFMWNFAGRQNDIQGHGEIGNGNWISGIPFLDNARLGDQDRPSTMNNRGTNKYYMLPLLLGLAGMVYQYRRDKRQFWVVAMLFVLTGLAIVVYLNQTPLQPRERDYAYAGSFYAFAIWIGMAALALFELLRRKLGETPSAALAGAACLAMAPGILCAQNWDDHDRTGRYMARDFGHNYLASCERDALLVTAGDNDTFPLWYMQEVEGFRTDVRVLCVPYMSTDWYINQLRRQVWESPAVQISMSPEKYAMGTRDVVYVVDRPEMFLNEKYEASRDELAPVLERYRAWLAAALAKSGFPAAEPATWSQLNDPARPVPPLQLTSLARMVASGANAAKYGIADQLAADINAETRRLTDRVGAAPLPIKLAVKFATDDSRQAQLQNGYNYLPSKKLLIPVDRRAVIDAGVLRGPDTAKIVDRIVLNISQSSIGKGDLFLLDVVASNADWRRPIYCTSVSQAGVLAGLRDYMRNEGFAYRLVPQRVGKGSEAIINPDMLYDNLMNKFEYRGLADTDVYLDWTNMRTLRMIALRERFTALADTLHAESEAARLAGDDALSRQRLEMARGAMRRSLDVLPLSRLPVDYYSRGIFRTLYRVGLPELGDSVAVATARTVVDELAYINQRDLRVANGYQREEQLGYLVLQEITATLRREGRDAAQALVSRQLRDALAPKSPAIAQIDQLTPEQKDVVRLFYSVDQATLDRWMRTMSPEDRVLLERFNALDDFEAKVVNIYASWGL